MTSRRHRLTRSRPVRWFLGAAYSGAVAFVLLEVFLRLFDPIGIRYYFDTARYFRSMKADPDYGYLHTPGYRATLQGVEVTINSEGLRSPEFDVQKPTGEKRLMILGDSVVFGWGAPQDSIFPAVLQAMIGDSSRVIAAGVGSWNTRTEYEFFRKRGQQYGPDRLILLVVPNDVEPKKVGRSDVSRLRLEKAVAASNPVSPLARGFRRTIRFAAKRSYVLATVQHVSMRRSASNRLADLYRDDSPAWEDAERALASLIDLCERNGTELGVFLYADLSSDFSRAFHAAYSGYLDARAVPYHLLSGDIYDRRFRNSLVDGHPNAAGHRRIAREMLRFIRPAS